MKDLENALSSKDIVHICHLITTYMLKNQCKKLVKFIVDQHNRFYLDTHLRVIPFIVSRIKTIRSNEYKVTKRINRVSICELFVMLSQMPRHQSTSLEQKTYIPSEQQYRFIVKVRNTTVDCNTFVKYIMRFISDADHTFTHSVLSLIKHCVSYNQKGIIYELSHLYKSKAVVNVSLLQAEVEFEGIDVSNYNSVTVFLFYLMLFICPSDRKWICKNIVELCLQNLQKKHFNIVLMGYDIAFCLDLYTNYHMHNPFYTSTVLQCAVKIDYLFESLANDFPKVKIPTESFQTDECEIKTDALFTFPEIQLNSSPKLCNSSPIEDTVRIITIDGSKKKEKTAYDIHKGPML